MICDKCVWASAEQRTIARNQPNYSPFEQWIRCARRKISVFTIWTVCETKQKTAPREFIGTRTLLVFHGFGLLFDLIVKIAPNSHLQQNAQTLTIPLIPMNSTNKNGLWKYVRSYKLPTNETLSAENQGGICCFFFFSFL